MSIKTIHLFFIIASTLICLFYGAWNFIADQSPAANKMIGSFSLLLTAGLVVYANRFIKKMKAL